MADKSNIAQNGIEVKDIFDMSTEELNVTRRCFEKAQKTNKDWLDKMPQHTEHEVPGFLTNKSLQGMRKDVVQKLRELLKSKFSLATISDILLYNDYESLDEIVDEKKDFSERAKQIYPDFGFKFKKKVGAEDSRIYSAEENNIKVILEFLEGGSFLSQSDPQVFQDAVSSVVDTQSFSAACKIETEFMQFEISELLSRISELESRKELEDLISQARQKKSELQFKTQAYETIEKLINSKSKGKNESIEDR